MTFFKNLFSCYCSEENDKDIKTEICDIKKDVKKIENDINVLFRMKADVYTDIKRLEDKLNNHFSLLTHKIDNVIMILNNR
jgi:hypothetical protein